MVRGSPLVRRCDVQSRPSRRRKPHVLGYSVVKFFKPSFRKYVFWFSPVRLSWIRAKNVQDYVLGFSYSRRRFYVTNEISHWHFRSEAMRSCEYIWRFEISDIFPNDKSPSIINKLSHDTTYVNRLLCIDIALRHKMMGPDLTGSVEF